MEFEVLKRSHVKRGIIIGIVAVFIISAIILNFTRAKYRSVSSVPIIDSEINYKVPDLNMVSLYIGSGEGGYEEADTIPTSGYTLNIEQSYCGQSNNGEIVKDDTVSIVYENGQVNVLGLTKKGTKCYLYFDEQKIQAADTILTGKDIQSRNNFNTTVTEDTTGVIYQTTDWKGTSYYFAGAPTDNWVRFGGFYWRIIRINGDGSIRLIYNGTSTTTIGTETLTTTSQSFNSNYDRSEYVGLKYTSSKQHGQNVDSDILNYLQSWYTNSGLSSPQFSENIDTNIGFCSDRNVANGDTWISQPNKVGGSSHDYAAYERLNTNKKPSLACNSSDIIKEPVGLITADEVAYAGGIYGQSNNSYYLYNNQDYWTMSPSEFIAPWGEAHVFPVSSNGWLGGNSVHNTMGVRPVINLSSDVQITGSGTSTDPYTAVEA